MAELEDEDDFPNDFDGLDFDNIPGLQAPTISRGAPEIFVPSPAIPRNIVPSNVASPVPSNWSNGVEDMDPTFFAAVDALEARALSEMPAGCHTMDAQSSSSFELVNEQLNLRNPSKTALDSPQGGMSVPSSRYFARVDGAVYLHGTHSLEIEGTSGLNQIHECSMPPPELSSMIRKGKRKAEPEEDIDVRVILAGYETEITCPICCDLLVGAQVANPCGHTCCGECGYAWLAQNKCEPSCAVCRSNLSTRMPLLPNFAVDSFVRQHLQVLARSGRPEWQEKGYRTIEMNKRVESWKKQTDDRTAKKKLNETTRLRRRQTRYYEADDYPYPPPWVPVVDESMDDDEPLVVRVMPRRGTRSRN